MAHWVGDGAARWLQGRQQRGLVLRPPLDDRSCKDDDSAVTGGGVDRFARTSIGGSVAKRREGLLPLVALSRTEARLTSVG
jgi:hypothetical protein